MAPAPKKKYGPLTAVGWVAVLGGSILAYVLYKRYEANAAANAANATTGGSTIPNPTATTTTTGGQGTVAGAFSSFTAWEQAAIAAATQAVPGYSAAQAYNDITDWVNGSCVSSSGYTALSAVINSPSVGLPQGFGTSLPTLSVCPQASTAPPPATTTTAEPPTAITPPASGPTVVAPPPSTAIGPAPNLPAAIAAAMTNAGEVLGGAPQWDANLNEWLFFTNKGGIFNIAPSGVPGPTFYGSYEGLPAADKGPGPTGSTNRTFNGLKVNADGTYTLTDTLGENYTFTPSTPNVGKAA